MWVVPGATQRYVKNKSVGVRDKTLGLIVHVQDGNGELTGWFNNPASEASSAWQVMKTGKVFQFGDPDVDKFWTQGAGNPDYGAAEGEGKPSEPMTPEQIEGFAQIYAKGHLEEGWPFQLAEKPGDRGLGWHGMGGAAWGNHPNCPGDIRKAQRTQILARAKQIAAPTSADWFDMATQADLEKTLRDVLGIPVGQKVLDGADGSYIVKTIAYVRDQLMGQSASIKDQISKLNDPAAIAAAIPDTIAQQVVDQLAARLKGA